MSDVIQSKVYSFRLPVDLVGRLDRARGSKSRTEYFRGLIEAGVSGRSKNSAENSEVKTQSVEPVGDRPWLKDVKTEAGRLTASEKEARGIEAGSSVRREYLEKLPGREKVLLDYVDEKGEVHRNRAIQDLGWGERFYSLLEHDLFVRGVLQKSNGMISRR